MACTLVQKAACNYISMQDSKHLHPHCNSNMINNSIGNALHQFKAIKHEFDSEYCAPSCDMGALIITEHISPTSLRLAAANSSIPPSFIIKRSSSNKKSLWDSCPAGGRLPFKHMEARLLLFGLLLCFSFILAICTLDASMRLHAGKSRSPQERRSLVGFHTDNTEEFNSLGQRIEHMHPALPSHSHVGTYAVKASTTHNHEAALRGLGVVFSKGTKSMHNLIIANLEESCDMLDFRLFLRTLYRSGAMVKADLVLLFPWPSLPQDVAQVLQEEQNSFEKLLKSSTLFSNANNTSAFGANAFEGLSSMKDDASSADKRRFIMWGENSTSSKNEESHSISSEYGSVVGFHMNELDSTDGFSEFLSNPPSQLRRWLCYQMLLGLLRFKFRLVMLVDLGGVVILDDVFSRGKKKDFLYLSLEDASWADATADCCQATYKAEERKGPLPKGIQHNDQMVVSNSHADTIRSVPLRYGRSQIRMMKSLDDTRDRAVHEPMLHKKGIGGARKRGIKIHVDHSKGLLVKRKKQEMVDKSTRYGSRDDKGNEDTHEEQRMLRKTWPDATGKAMNNMMKLEEAGALRGEGYAGTKQIMMEMVYGKEVWECLEQAEKHGRKVVSSRVILGSMRSAKGLANSMAVEIVRVALQRNSKRSFPDRALLSHLVQKSSHLLGKRVTDSLQLMGNGESMVHSLDNSKQRNVFIRTHDGQKYTIVQASSLNVRPKSMQPHQREQSLMSNLTLSHVIRADICASLADSAAFYDDCSLQ